jgi:Fic family protein
VKIPQAPPNIADTMRDLLKNIERFCEVTSLSSTERTSRHYLHWDRLRRYPPPQGFTSQEWWLALKFSRRGILKPVPLKDKLGQHFQFCVPDIVAEELHRIDVGAGAISGAPDPITNPQTRDKYLMRSLMEEAITSSQLEGAVTTREVAKEMIRTGRAPHDISEQMILNNYLTMRHIRTLKDSDLTPEMVFEVHRIVTDKTLKEKDGAGRFRTANEKRVVGDDYGEVYRDPPVATELVDRLGSMCAFANGKIPDNFIHPVVRAIILHFWLAYDHPFVDGNGRTARALFYWSMLRAGYWLFEFISISHILRKAPIKYGRSFLYTETDENDLTYFIVAQTTVIRKAIAALHAYLDEKTKEVNQLESHLRALQLFNHRQVDLLRHALKHPYQQYTIASHQKSHGVVYQTARTDLTELGTRGLLEQRKRGRQMVFAVPRDLPAALRQLDPAASKGAFTGIPPAQQDIDGRFFREMKSDI